MEFVKRPMFIGAIAAITASVAAFYFRSFIPLFAVMVTAVILVMMVFLKADKRLFAVLAIILIVFLGAAGFYNKTDAVERISGKVISAEITFCEDELSRGMGYSSTVRVICDDAAVDNAKLSMYSYNTGGYLQGDRLKATIEISPLDEKFRMSKYCDGVIGECKIISVEDTLSPNRFGAAIGIIRRYVRDRLFSNLSNDSASTVVALVTGDREYLSDEFYIAVKNAGVSHVMVVSGLHLSIIMGAFCSLVALAGKNRFVNALLSVAAVIFISAVCGFTMSIMRAGLMFIVAALAPVFGRDNDVLNSLGTAMTLIILHTPFAIFSVALQLSALSTFGILYITPEIMKLIKVKNKLFSKLIELICVTLSAAFMTFPVAVYWFGYLSVVAPITNILISHAVSGALITAVLGLVTVFEPLSQTVFIVCELITRYINFIITLFGNDKCAVTVGKWAVMPSVFLIGFVLWLINYCKKGNNLLK